MPDRLNASTDLLVDIDSELVSQAKKELPYRTQAYEALIRKYQKLVLRICIKMLDNQADAEDMSQEIMVKVFHALPKFEQRSSFKTWISRISTNSCITAYEKIKRNNELKRMISVDPTVSSTTRITVSERDINKAMQLLDLKDRQLLTLRYVSDLKIEEIADISGLGLSATKMRLYRAQDALQALMKA